MSLEKSELIIQLRQLLKSRSGIKFADYGFVRDIKEWREAKRLFDRDRYQWRVDGEQAEKMLRFIELRDNISANDILSRATGRLWWNSEKQEFEYHAFQFSSETRAGVARLCSQVIWDYLRDSGYSTVKDIRKAAKGYFKNTIANRWFN